MSTWIRIWNRSDLKSIADRLLVVGVLQTECYMCRALGLPMNTRTCPTCGKHFSFVGFRKKVHAKDLEDFADLTIIDFEDFTQEFNRQKAHALFDEKG
jgi:hypothetical protein